MSTIGEAGRNPGDIAFRLAEVERKLNEVLSARRLVSAAIGAGGVRVHSGGRIQIQDAQGQDAFVAAADGLTLSGLLEVFGSIRVAGGGDIDVADGGNVVIDGGELRQRVGNTFIPLAALAGGAEADVVAAEQSLIEPAGSSTSYTDLSTVGPSVTFTTHTGKWIILIVAHVGVSGDRTAGRMSYQATGAQSVSAADARSSLVVSPDLDSQGSAVYANVHTGSPGSITVTAKYRVIPPAASPPPNGAAGWQNRALIVIPY